MGGQKRKHLKQRKKKLLCIIFQINIITTLKEQGRLTQDIHFKIKKKFINTIFDCTFLIMGGGGTASKYPSPSGGFDFCSGKGEKRFGN